MVNVVCLLFGAGQVLCSGFIRAICCKQLPVYGYNADESIDCDYRIIITQVQQH